jgi:hypothetical protein
MERREAILRSQSGRKLEAGAALRPSLPTSSEPVEGNVAPAPQEQQSDAVSAAHREMVRELGEA